MRGLAELHGTGHREARSVFEHDVAEQAVISGGEIGHVRYENERVDFGRMQVRERVHRRRANEEEVHHLPVVGYDGAEDRAKSARVVDDETKRTSID